MLAAVQGVVKGNTVYSTDNDLKQFDGRTVTIIINEIKHDMSDKQSFLNLIENDDLVVSTGLDADKYIEELRQKRFCWI